jgi:hypothetical protein
LQSNYFLTSHSNSHKLYNLSKVNKGIYFMERVEGCSSHQGSREWGLDAQVYPKRASPIGNPVAANSVLAAAIFKRSLFSEKPEREFPQSSILRADVPLYEGEKACAVFEIPQEEKESFISCLLGGRVCEIIQGRSANSELRRIAQILTLLAMTESIKYFLEDVHKSAIVHLLNVIMNFITELQNEIAPNPMYITVVGDMIRIVFTRNSVDNLSDKLKIVGEKFVDALPKEFSLMKQDLFENSFNLKSPDGLHSSSYFFISFFVTPDEACILKRGINQAVEDFGIKEDDIDEWLQNVGDTVSVIKIPSRIFLTESVATDIANALMKEVFLEDGEIEIPDYAALVENIAQRLQAIKMAIGDEPIYLSVIGNEIRIVTTIIGESSVHLALDPDQNESRLFIDEMQAASRLNIEEENRSNGWFKFGERYRVAFINVNWKAENFKRSFKKLESIYYLQNRATGERVKLPKGYTVRKSEPKKPLVSLQGRVMGLPKRRVPESTFEIAVGGVYDLEKWDKGLFLLRLGAWVTTLALAFTPLLGLWAVCALVDYFKKREVYLIKI